MKKLVHSSSSTESPGGYEVWREGRRYILYKYNLGRVELNARTEIDALVEAESIAKWKRTE